MNYRKLFTPTLAVAVILAAAVATIAIADPSGDAKTASQPEFKLPPGWTAEDMQACVLAGTPGKQHELLAKSAGEWQGKTTMWMVPGAEPMSGECSFTVTPIMDGRYIKCEMEGDMPGMGPYSGAGVYGFDNVSQQYVTSWIDNHSTGIMNGVGEASADGKTLTWEYTHNCPITKKPIGMREVETFTGPNSKTLEMFGTDPKSGKEFQMMRIEFTRS